MTLETVWCDLGSEPRAKWLTLDSGDVYAEGQPHYERPEVVIPVLCLLVVMLTDCINYCLAKWLQTQTVTLLIYFPHDLLLKKSIHFLVHSVYFEKKMPKPLSHDHMTTLWGGRNAG